MLLEVGPTWLTAWRCWERQLCSWSPAGTFHGGLPSLLCSARFPCSAGPCLLPVILTSVRPTFQKYGHEPRSDQRVIPDHSWAQSWVQAWTRVPWRANTVLCRVTERKRAALFHLGSRVPVTYVILLTSLHSMFATEMTHLITFLVSFLHSTSSVSSGRAEPALSHSLPSPRGSEQGLACRKCAIHSCWIPGSTWGAGGGVPEVALPSKRSGGGRERSSMTSERLYLAVSVPRVWQSTLKYCDRDERGFQCASN